MTEEHKEKETEKELCEHAGKLYNKLLNDLGLRDGFRLNK